MNKMKLILIDMHITDAIAETKAQMGGDERILSEKYDEQLFKNYGVTHADFIKSYKFYENNPSLLNKMYDDILNELSKREEEAGKKN